MKVAYLFSGHSRTWPQCVDHFFKNVYNIIPGDIFIHTWDCVSSGFGAHWNHWSDHLKEIAAKKIDASRILEVYSPVQILVEKDRGLDHWIEKYPGIHTPFLGIKNLLYSQKKVFEMSKQHQIYDRYICTRLDINYLSNLDLRELESTSYIVSNSQVHGNSMVFDFWSIGSIDHLEIKSKHFDEIDNYWFSHKDNMHYYYYEHSLHDYLFDNNIHIYRSNMRYNVPRINNTITTYI